MKDPGWLETRSCTWRLSMYQRHGLTRRWTLEEGHQIRSGRVEIANMQGARRDGRLRTEAAMTTRSYFWRPGTRKSSGWKSHQPRGRLSSGSAAAVVRAVAPRRGRGRTEASSRSGAHAQSGSRDTKDGYFWTRQRGDWAGFRVRARSGLVRAEAEQRAESLRCSFDPGREVMSWEHSADGAGEGAGCVAVAAWLAAATAGWRGPLSVVDAARPPHFWDAGPATFEAQTLVASALCCHWLPIFSSQPQTLHARAHLCAAYA